jgi:hypothetical protein
VWHPDPDRLTLAALPAEDPDLEVEAHLADCALCRSHVESLHRTVGLARDGGDTADDGQGPPERIWQAITQELAGPTPIDGRADPGPAEPDPGRRPERRSERRVAVLVAAAVLALAVGGLGGYLAGRVDADPEPGPVVARLAPIGGLDPGGSGQVSMLSAGDERRMVITLAGVGELPEGDYLEVWLLDPSATRLIALGGLTRDGDGYRGTFTVPSDIPLPGFPTVDVSVERWDGDPGHSGESVLRGTLP